MGRRSIWAAALLLALLAAVSLAPPVIGASLHRPATRSVPDPGAWPGPGATDRSALGQPPGLSSASLVPEDLPDGCPPAAWTDLSPSGVAPDHVYLAFFGCQLPDREPSPYLVGLAMAEQGIDGADGGRDRETLMAYLLAFFPHSLMQLRITDHQLDGPLVGRQTAWAAGIRLGQPSTEAYWVVFRRGGTVAALNTVGLSLEETAGLATLVAERLARLAAIP